MKKAGIPEQKLIPCGPVFAHHLFDQQTNNGDKIVNVGASIPKKRFEDFIELATKVPERDFHLYSIGFLSNKYKQMNIDAGTPLTVIDPIEHKDFAKRITNYKWMVYTADPVTATVGWPLTLLEAQAAGVGVCMRNIRPDLKDYLGGGAILYDSIEELVDIVKKPVPEEMRLNGYKNAAKYDIKKHIYLLTEIWDRC
ncbi:hypothetical protein GCM10007941_08070 [Amphritea balenae]|nr:hypothetical protein GCM10007941_08070 [Amphritea balenae]